MQAFYAGSSGGTASPRAQVIGLEVMCGEGTSIESFRKNMRSLFAHETAHSWQRPPPATALKDRLLYQALLEGGPDYLSWIVTGQQPSDTREA